MRLECSREVWYSTIPKDLAWVELGVETGSNAACILKAAEPASLTLVDPWVEMDYKECPWTGATNFNLDEQYAEVCERFASDERVKVIRKRSHEAVAEFDDEGLDVVYVDANHTHENCLQDAREWFEKLRPGGFILFHDYVEDGYKFGVVSAVAEFLENTPNAVFVGNTAEGFSTAIVRKEAK